VSASLRPDQVDLATRLGAVRLEHPVIDASGTFDLLEYARRYEGDYFADFPFAAYVPKTVTLEARTGNPPPRVAETPSGMINAIGLANPGVTAFVKEFPRYARLRQPIIISVGGNAEDQYAAVVRVVEESLSDGDTVQGPSVEGYELNVSCPNVATGLQIGADPEATGRVVRAVRARTSRFLLVKLTPNVTDVTAAARAAVDEGADGVSLVNTFKAMVLDRQTLRPFLGNRTGGLCGPAIKPIALRMVAEVADALPGVPIVGMGGVSCGLDALEFIACGASAVAVGAANFGGFEAPVRIVYELRAEMAARGLVSVPTARGLALESGCSQHGCGGSEKGS
jgi:dihydroorotate dehydrogenase (NAD+) catalytic subunit